MVMPKRFHERLVSWMPKDVCRAIREEAKRRRKPIGFIIQEAFESRAVMVKR